MKSCSNACFTMRTAGDHGTTGFIAWVRLVGRPHSFAAFSSSSRLACRRRSGDVLGFMSIESATQRQDVRREERGRLLIVAPDQPIGQELLHGVRDLRNRRVGRPVGRHGAGRPRRRAAERSGTFLGVIAEPHAAEHFRPPVGEAVPAPLVAPRVVARSHVRIRRREMAVEQRSRRPAGAIVDVDVRAQSVLRRWRTACSAHPSPAGTSAGSPRDRPCSRWLRTNSRDRSRMSRAFGRSVT